MDTDRERSVPTRGAHCRGCPAEVLLLLAALTYLAFLVFDPREVVTIPALPTGQRILLQAAVIVVAAVVGAAQAGSLTGPGRRHRARVLAVATGWWVFAGVESALTDWRSPAWLLELVLASLAVWCMRAVARDDARSLPATRDR